LTDRPSPVPAGNASAEEGSEPPPNDLWVFGYGSLVWRMDLPFEEGFAAAVEGYARRFFQLSPDHRGTEDAPGRVVTVIAADAGSPLLAGMVYRIAAHRRAETIKALDHREKAGYERVEVTARALDGSRSVSALMYIGKPGNPGFFPTPDDEIAQIVAHARGPSGENLEYVERLHEALTQLGHPDPHVATIATRARAFRASPAQNAEGHGAEAPALEEVSSRS
jgi:glutathione-specific gamma-glutamylcyclotransferase